MTGPPDPPATFHPQPILGALASHAVDFVLVGGLAGLAHGSSYPTYDVDIAYARDPENLDRVGATLLELGATLRGADPGLPLQLDGRMLANGMNFTFDTRLGPLDLLGESGGLPDYRRLREAATLVEIDGVEVRLASLDHLIAMKTAAGRPKDLLMASEYIALAEEIEGGGHE